MDKRKEEREDLGKVSLLSVKIENKSSILIDLSRNGFQLIIPFAPYQNDVNIEFSVKEKKFNFKGYIHWASRSLIKLNWYQVGVSFIDPPSELIGEIEGLLSVY